MVQMVTMVWYKLIGYFDMSFLRTGNADSRQRCFPLFFYCFGGDIMEGYWHLCPCIHLVCRKEIFETTEKKNVKLL